MSGSTLPNKGLNFSIRLLRFIVILVAFPFLAGHASLLASNSLRDKSINLYEVSSSVYGNFESSIWPFPAADPVSMTVCSGTSAVFEVTTGAAWQWQECVTGGVFTDLPGETTSKLTLAGVTLVMNGYKYRCIVDLVPSAAATLTVDPLPSVTNASATTICSGTSPNFNLTANIPSNFTWTLGVNVGGITGATAGSGTSLNQVLTNPSNTTAGSIEYLVTPISTAGSCAGAPYSVVVTVNPNPLLSGTLSPPAICSNSLFSYNPASISVGAVFNWSRVAIAGISNPIASGAGNPNEVLVNTTAVTIPVTYSYQISSNGCNSTQNVIVQVHPLPVLTSTLLPSAICSNSVFSYAPQSSTPGTLFSWSRAAVPGISNAASSGNGNPNETLINLTSAAVNVTYVYTLSANGCSNPTTFSVVVTVNPSATLTSSLTPGPICSGSVFNYTATSATPGAVLNWSRASSAGIIQPASSGLGDISEFLTSTSPLPTVVTYQYTLFVNGCVSTQNVTVTVNPSPDLTSSLAPPVICSGSTLHYAATSSTPGVTFSWTRATVAGILQPAAAGIGNVNEVLSNTSAAPVSVTYVYTLSANSCSNVSVFNVVVTVNPIPPVPAITASGPTTFCTGDEVVLTAPAGYSSYQWTNGSSTRTIHVTTSGSFSVVVKDAAGCQSAPSLPTVTTALPAPAAPTSGGNITQCIDTPAQVIVPSATAPAGCVVKWYDAPTGGNLIVAPSLSGLGTRTYYAESSNSLTGCASLSRTQVVLTIIAHPAAPVKDPDIVECEKSPLQTLTATATVPFGSSIKWYTTPAGGTPVSPTLNAVATVSYYAETDNGICTSLSRTKVTLTINPAPVPPVSLGNITECEHVPVQTLTALSSNPAAVWYSTPTGGSPVGSPTLSAVGSATYYAESVLGGCPSLTRSAGVVLTITATPEAPVSGGDIIECEMNPIQTLTAGATAPTGSTVKWYTSAVGGVAVASPTINSATSKTYYAESDNGSCKSLTRTPVLLQIKAAPKAPVAGKNITECATLPNIQTLTATASTTSGSTLVWFETATGGDPVTPSLNQIGTATYYAEANNGNCNSAARSTGVVLTISPTPEAPTVINVTECPQKPLQVLTAQAETPPAGVTVSWYNTLSGGTVVTSPTLKTVGSKIYYAESKLDKCINPTRTPATLTITSIVADPILKVKGIDSIAVCEAAPLDTIDARDLFTVVPTVTYVCFDAATGGFEVSPLLDYPGTKTVFVAAKSVATGCLGFNRIQVRLVIHAAPLPPVSTGDIVECALKPVQTLDANKSIIVGSGTKVVWYDKATGGSVIAKPILAKADTTVYYFAESVSLTTKCVSLTRTQVKLSIGSTTASAASNSPLALGQTLQLKGGPEASGNSYLWKDPNGFVFATMDVIIPNVSESAAGMYHLTVTSANGCSAIDSVNVILDIARADAQKPVCIGSTLYLAGYPDNMKSYAWIGPGGFSSTLQNPSIDHVSIANSGTYTLTVTNMNNATSSDTVSVSFKPLPIPIAEATTVCPSGMMQLNAGPNGMTSYLWSGPNGFTSTLQKPAPTPYLNPAEDFKLTVVDWNGCEASKVITPKPFQPSASSNSPLCSGDTLRLRGEPNGMAVYRWSGPNNFLSNLQSPSINNVNAATATGDYTLTVIDKAGCTFSTKVTVSFNTPAPVPTITPNINPICEGSTLTLNGGPSSMAGYDWSGPDGFISKDQNPQITNVKDVNAGKYSLKITTPEGCKSTFETNVTVVSVKFNGTYGPYCINDSPVTLSVTPSGGTFSGPGVSGNIFDPKVAGEGNHTIQYTYSGTGGLCTVVSFKYIDVVTVPNLVTNNPVLPSCTGSTADLTLPAVTLGSTPGLILSYWTDAKATLGLQSPKAVSAGMYYIKGATVSGKCFDIKPVRVMQPDSLRAVMKIKPTDCYGDTTGTMEVSVTMGTAPFTYLWSTNPPQSTSKAVSLKAGVYTVVITDAKSCSLAITDTVKEANPFKMYFSKNNIDCLSDANGSAKVDSVLSNGVKADINLFTYAWNSNPVQTTRQAVKLKYGYYTIALTNEKGCTVRDSVFIDAMDSIPPTIVCPKDIDMIVHATKATDGSPNNIVVDLGKPIAKDNCTVVDVVNDAPEKFRFGQTIVTWTVTDQSGMVDTCQQVVNIKEFPTIPQLVSPNGDGINDTFVIEGIKAFPNSQLLIFTRSGQLVYQSDDYQDDWDGRYGASTFSHNKLVAPGVYYYVLSLGGGTKQKVQGYVYIYY